MHIEVEKPRINPAHFIAIIGGIAINAFILGGVWVNLGNSIDGIDGKYDELSLRLDKEATDRKERLRDYQVTMTGVNSQISQIPALQFKQEQQSQFAAENKAGLAETNKRIDRVVESFGGKLDTVIDTINKIATRVEVLSSKLDDANGKSDRTVFRTPVLRP